MGEIKLTQRDMLMEVYRVVCGNGQPGLAEKVDRIEQGLPMLMSKDDCRIYHEAREAGSSRRWDKAKGVVGMILPAAAMCVAILVAIFK